MNPPDNGNDGVADDDDDDDPLAYTLNEMLERIHKANEIYGRALIEMQTERGCPPERDPLSNQSLPISCPQCDRHFEVGERFMRHVCVFHRLPSHPLMLFFLHKECVRQWYRDAVKTNMCTCPLRADAVEIKEFAQKYEICKDESRDTSCHKLYYFRLRKQKKQQEQQ